MASPKKGDRIRFEDENGTIHTGIYKGRDSVSAKPMGYVERTGKWYSIQRILDVLA